MLRASEFKNKEVINLANSEKLGFVCDFEICTSSGEISAILVPDRSKSFFTKNNFFRIPWSKISGIGDDIILVNVDADV